jgi:hypothetical protein
MVDDLTVQVYQRVNCVRRLSQAIELKPPLQPCVLASQFSFVPHRLFMVSKRLAARTACSQLIHSGG